MKLKMESDQYRAKTQLLLDYKEQFGIILHFDEHKKLFNQLDDKGLEIVLKKKLATKKQFIAAQTIQARFRGFICRKWYQEVHKIRSNVAIRYQRLWRKYYRNVVVPRNQRARESRVIEVV